MDFGDKLRRYTVEECAEERKSLWKAFESGRPAAAWDRFNNDWVPTLNLGKTKYREVNHEAVKVRAARSKERRKRSLERLEMLVDWPSKISTLERVHLLKKQS